MATVAESLFGVTPESLQQERQNALLNRGIQLAQLDPFQQAYANIYAGAGNVGRGVGGLLGAEDPELMRVRQRQQLLQNVDITDPKVLRERAAFAMQQKDYAAASALASRADEVEAKRASTAKDVAAASRERQQAVPESIQKANTIAAIKQAVRVLENQEQTPDVQSALQVYKEQLTELEKGKEFTPTEIQKLQQYRSTLKDPTLIAEVDATIKALGEGKGTKVFNTIEGMDKAISAVVGKGIGEEVSSLGKNVTV